MKSVKKLSASFLATLMSLTCVKAADVSVAVEPVVVTDASTINSMMEKLASEDAKVRKDIEDMKKYAAAYTMEISGKVNNLQKNGKALTEEVANLQKNDKVMSDSINGINSKISQVESNEALLAGHIENLNRWTAAHIKADQVRRETSVGSTVSKITGVISRIAGYVAAGFGGYMLFKMFNNPAEEIAQWIQNTFLISGGVSVGFDLVSLISGIISDKENEASTIEKVADKNFVSR